MLCFEARDSGVFVLAHTDDDLMNDMIGSGLDGSRGPAGACVLGAPAPLPPWKFPRRNSPASRSVTSSAPDASLTRLASRLDQ